MRCSLIVVTGTWRMLTASMALMVDWGDSGTTLAMAWPMRLTDESGQGADRAEAHGCRCCQAPDRKLIEMSVTVGLMPSYAQIHEILAMCGGFLPSGHW